jgi:hypothetical protein
MVENGTPREVAMATISSHAMKQLIERSRDFSRRYAKHTVGSGTLGKLFPPASAARIKAAEKRQGWEFPPSYRTLLGITNGWEKYNQLYTLIGVDGSHTQKALNYIEKEGLYYPAWVRRHYQKTLTVKMKGYYSLAGAKKDPGVVADVQKLKAQRHYFGTNFMGCHLYFDPSTRKANGEMEVVIQMPSKKAPPRRQNFIAMLLWDIKGKEVRLEKP